MKEVARAIICNENGQVLLGRRARGHGQGRLALIGGKPEEKDEDLMATIIREVQEEIGALFEGSFYDVEIDEESVPGESWKVYFYEGTLKGELSLNSEEVSEIVYVDELTIDKHDITFNHKKKLLKYFEDKRRISSAK